MRKLDCQTSLVSNTAAVYCESITIDTAHGKQQRPSTESQRTSYKAPWVYKHHKNTLFQMTKP